MKVKLKDLRVGDQIKMFNWSGNVVTGELKYGVVTHELINDKVFISLESESGNRKRFSFLNPNNKVTMWTSNDIETIEVCKCCGK